MTLFSRKPAAWFRLGLLATTLFFLQFTFSATVLQTPSARAATTYFSDGFETGDFSKWTLPNGDSNGSNTVQSAIVNSGSKAAQLTNTSGQYSYLYTALPGGPRAETYSRFYFRLAEDSSTLLMMARHDGNSSTWEATYNQFFHGFEIYFWNGANQVYGLWTGHDAININTWYCVEVYLNQTTTGRAEVWIDGQSIGSLDADLSTSTPMSRVLLYNDNIQTVYYDDVVVSDTYNGPVNVTPTPGATLNPSSVDFGNQNINTSSATRPVTLTNSGTAPLSIGSIGLSGGSASDFSQTNNCPSSLSPNLSCTINVGYKPAALGADSASLAVTTSAAGSPQTVALSGTGVNPAPGISLSSTSVSFSDQQVSTTSAARSVTLTNSGTAALTISGITVGGSNASNFAQTNTCGSSLAANASCTINVTFTPSAAGSRTASISIATNAVGSPHNIALSGNGVTSLTYFNDDFESGNFSKWTFNNSDSTGQTTVQTTVAHGGTQAASLANSTSSQYCYISTALSGGPVSQTSTRFAFRIHNPSLGTDIAIARNDYGTNAWELAYNPNSQAIDIYIWGAGNQIYILSTPTRSIQADTWYNLEVFVNQATSGQGEVWLDGTSIGSVNQDLSAANPYSRLMFYNASPSTVYIDDVNVASTR
jgi:hypothetical protein